MEDKLNNTVTKIDEDFESFKREMNIEFEALQREMNVRFELMDKRFSDIHWMIAVLVGIPLITITIILLVKALA